MYKLDMIGLSIIAIIITAFVTLYFINSVRKNADIAKLSTEIAQLKIALSDCVLRTQNAETAIDKQNAAIESVRIDTVVIERQINNIVSNYAETRVDIEKRIEKDTSCENKFFIIDDVMRRYHGVGVRPEGHH